MSDKLQFDEQRFQAGLARATESMRRLGLAFRKAGFAIAGRWQEFVEELYRLENGNPPGSDRTARLRKKRRDAIRRWASKRFAD